MTNCFEMVRIQVSARREVAPQEMSPWEDTNSFLELDPQAAAVINPIFASFDLNAERFMARFNTTFRQMRRFPWAIIAFDREYPLGGYFCQIRDDPRTLSFTAYTVRGGWSGDSMPPVSCVVAWDRPALQAAAAKGPEVLGSSWNALAGRTTHQHWLCLCDPLDDEWVQTHRDSLDQSSIEPTFIPK